jgi:hypothetical protein
MPISPVQVTFILPDGSTEVATLATRPYIGNEVVLAGGVRYVVPQKPAPGHAGPVRITIAPGDKFNPPTQSGITAYLTQPTGLKVSS